MKRIRRLCKWLKRRIRPPRAYEYAILVFLVTLVVDFFKTMPASQMARFELLCNGLMFIFAVFGFFRTRRFAVDNSINNPNTILSNVAIPIIALSMNIDVFGHTITREQLWNDLWGWHLCWVICVSYR